MRAPAVPMLASLETFGLAYFAGCDSLRRTQANALAAFGLGARQCEYGVIRSGLHWRLREYGGPKAAPSLLIVAAPIKRPYIWDLTPSVAVVRYCLGQGLRVYLLEWIPPSVSGANSLVVGIASVTTISPSSPMSRNNESMAAIALAIAAGGAVKSAKTTVLMTGPEAVAGMRKADAVAKV